MLVLLATFLSEIAIPNGLLQDLSLAVEMAGPDKLLQCARDENLDHCEIQGLKHDSIEAIKTTAAILRYYQDNDGLTATPDTLRTVVQIKRQLVDNNVNAGKCPMTYSQAFTCPRLKKRKLYDVESYQSMDVQGPEVTVYDTISTRRTKNRGIRTAGSSCGNALIFVGIVVLLASIAGMSFGTVKIISYDDPIQNAHDTLRSHCKFRFGCKPGINLPETKTTLQWYPGYYSNPCGSENPCSIWIPPHQEAIVTRIKYIDETTGKVLDPTLADEIGLDLCHVYNDGDTNDVPTCLKYATVENNLKRKQRKWWILVGPSIAAAVTGIGMIFGGACS
eukprot:NODE_215_length_14308_cov_0.330987.p3 type:complete len:334 gc:universal NODE_215_length_14308_cov_0.330987:1708-2709(+)